MIALLLSLAWAAPDRSAPPPVAAAEPMELPAAEVRPLAPGVRLHHLRVPGVRRVTVDVVLGHGAVALRGRTDEAVVLLDETWTLASEGFDAARLEDHLARHDVDLYTSVGDETALAGVSVPLEALGAGLEVLEDVLRRPSFEASDLRRVVRDLTLDLRDAAPHDAPRVLRTVGSAAWFGPEDPRSGGLDPRALARLRSRDLHALHAAVLADAPVDVVVVGDLDADAVVPHLVRMLDGVGADVPPAPRLGARPAATPRVLGVDLPEQDQAWILLSVPAPARTAPDAAAFGAVAHALGGHFLSRLNLVLREEKGWTYGSRGTWRPDDADGRWVFVVDVAEADAGDALAETLRQLHRVAADGLTDDELSTARTNAVAGWNLALATADDASALWVELVSKGESIAEARARLEATRAVTAEATRDAAARWLAAEDRLVVVVGDRAVLDPLVAGAAGTAPTWHRPDQAVLGRLVPIGSDR